MLKSIRIDNFRGLKSVEIKGLRRLNLVTGRNGGGKTSLLEAVFLNCGAANASLVISIAAFRGDKVIQPESDRVLRANFTDLDESRHIQIHAEELRQARNRSRSLVIEAMTKEETLPGRSGREVFVSGVRSRFSGPSGKFVSTLNIHIPVLPPGAPLPAPQDIIKIDAPPKNPDLIYAHFVSPYFRDVEKEVHDQLVTAVKEKALPEILEMVSIVQSGIIDLSPVTEWNQPNVYVDVGLKKMLPVTVLGSGFFHTLRIALGINATQNGMILIDELEDGLHYSIFPKVAALLIKALENKRRQVFIATHSIELIEAFLTVAKESGFNDLCLINLSGTAEGVTVRYFDADEVQYAFDLNAELR
jgi:AAA15 family ATPase/GTPase